MEVVVEMDRIDRVRGRMVRLSMVRDWKGCGLWRREWGLIVSQVILIFVRFFASWGRFRLVIPPGGCDEAGNRSDNSHSKVVEMMLVFSDCNKAVVFG